MKHVIVLAALVSTNAMAIDFETEWAKFQPDFNRMRGIQVAKVEKSKAVVTPLEEVTAKVLPAMPSEDNVMEQVDPKSPERLGHKISDPAVKQKVTELYKKPDTVVYSINLTE